MKKDFLSVTTFAEVLELLGIKKMPTFSGVPVKLKEHFIAHFKAICIAELANDGVPVDWNDSSQNKYLPWFYFGSPSGFSYNDSNYNDSNANAGDTSHLCENKFEGKGHAPRQKTNHSKGAGSNSERSE